MYLVTRPLLFLAGIRFESRAAGEENRSCLVDIAQTTTQKTVQEQGKVRISSCML